MIVAVLAIGRARERDPRIAIAMTAMIVGGLLHAAYITAIGGDYMHGRLLLPAFFAVALPASIAVRRGALVDLTVAGLAGAWALVSVISLRPPRPKGPVWRSRLANGVGAWRSTTPPSG